MRKLFELAPGGYNYEIYPNVYMHAHQVLLTGDIYLLGMHIMHAMAIFEACYRS
jgi:hypothetical protein